MVITMERKYRIFIFSITLIVFICITLIMFNMYTNHKEVIKSTYSAQMMGDVVPDGVVDLTDVSRLYRGMKGIIALTDEEKRVGDVVSDGVIDLSDVGRIYRYYKKIISKLEIKKVTSLYYYAQSDYSDVKFCKTGYNVANNGCGITSFAMIASALVDPKYDPKYAANILCKNCPSCGSGGTPYKYFWDSSFLDEFGMKSEVLFFHDNGYINGNFGTTYISSEGTAILKAVNAGKPVILLIPNHYVALGPNNACSKDQVYYYDPDWKSKNGCYTPEEIYSFTWNYSKWCTSSSKWCGWHLAVAFTTK